MLSKTKQFYWKYIKIDIQDITLSGVLIGLYLISGKFIELNFQGIMHVGITFVFLIMFGIFFGPIKGVFFSLIADTFKMLITTGVGQWMWEYELITIGIPLMSWAFKFLFNVDSKRWWGWMLVINLITLLGIVLVSIISFNNPLLNKASNHSFDFNDSTMILIYSMSSVLTVIQISFFYLYKRNNNNSLKLIISIQTLVMMIVVIWIWIWGPIAYVRFLKRFGHNAGKINYYTYEKYYKVSLWARILKTPIIIPLYTTLLIPLYKATEFSVKKMQKNTF
ncbi:MAG: ECF transporter S component [Mycoplasma sp.]|nr:ECF transporter S component [Mycoplasma sp.]